jgi:hypothetical protein
LTACPVDEQTIASHGKARIGTCFDTSEAIKTANGKPLRLQLAGDALWVVAPGTVQWTAFEEDSSADSGTILGGEALDVKDLARYHFI